MNGERLGRLVRMLRVRQRLTQVELATRAMVSRRAVSMLECGRARQLKMGDVETVLASLGARLDTRVLWNGPERDRLLDTAHAALAASVKRRLERWGWLVRVEVSYSRFGERGRIDLLAWHPLTTILLVLEIKSDLVDVQQLLGSLDVKARLARHVIEPFGWAVSAVVPGIVFAEDRTTRNRLGRLRSLFDRFDVRGSRAVSWLRRPDGAPTGLLWFTAVPEMASRAAAPRVRHPRDSKSATQGAHYPARRPSGARC